VDGARVVVRPVPGISRQPDLVTSGYRIVPQRRSEARDGCRQPQDSEVDILVWIRVDYFARDGFVRAGDVDIEYPEAPDNTIRIRDVVAGKDEIVCDENAGAEGDFLGRCGYLAGDADDICGDGVLL
jgi:hypothetical protein